MLLNKFHCLPISVIQLFPQNKLSKLCDDCHLMAAKTTFRHHKVILILREVGRSFCSYLSGHIIDGSMRQRINKAVTDAEALSHIRDVC